MITTSTTQTELTNMKYFQQQIKGYMMYGMSKEEAVAKVKRNNLGRIDYRIDQAAKGVS